MDVPDELLQQWMFDDDESESKPPGHLMAVFTFGFVREMLRTDGLPPNHPRQISASRLTEYFETWQLKLGLVAVSRKTEFEVDPVPLFAFRDDEELTVHKKSDSSAPFPPPAAR